MLSSIAGTAYARSGVSPPPGYGSIEQARDWLELTPRTVAAQAAPRSVVVERRISSNDDDAEERGGGRIGLSSSDLELMVDRDSQSVGMRFVGLDIPQGAAISRAYVQFQVDDTSSGPASLLIRAQAADDTRAFANDDGNISSRALTNAQISWSPPVWGKIGAAGDGQRTPDLSALIREVTNRPGWRPGNALALIVTGTGKRVAEAHDGERRAAPLLHVRYRTPGAGGVLKRTFGRSSDDPPAPVTVAATQRRGLPAPVAAVAPQKRRFVALNGTDSADGSIDRPWRSIRYALSAMRPGDTLFIREGHYDEGGLDVRQSGSAASPTTIRNYPNEAVIVDGSLSEFRNFKVDAWEQVDASIGLWRTIGDGYGRDVVVGKVLAADGKRYALVPYWKEPGRAYGMADLVSTVYTVTRGPRYVGPGLFNDGGRLYIRLQHVPVSALHGRDVRVGLPSNPNDARLTLTQRSAVIKVSGSHVRIAGLELRGARRGIEIEGRASHVEVRDMAFDVPGGAVLMRNRASNVVFEDSYIHGGFPPWVAWSDMKGSDGQSRPASYSSFKISGGGGDFVSDVTFRNIHYDNVFDGMTLQGRNVKIIGNRGTFIDDMVQLGSNSAQIEISDNRIRGAGPGHNGKGDSRDPGSVYVHHNVIDSTREALWGKRDPDRILRDGYSGWRGHRPFPAHSSSELGKGNPWKIYSNTLIFNGQTANSGVGIQLWDERNATGVAHEVYNNILIETGGGKFVRGVNVGAGPQVFDGNVYWRRGGATSSPFFDDFRGRSGERDFDSLEAFRQSSQFAESMRWYLPGWEASGIQADPGLDAGYRPRANGPAGFGAVMLPKSFPGPRHGWRGALAPR